MSVVEEIMEPVGQNKPKRNCGRTGPVPMDFSEKTLSLGNYEDVKRLARLGMNIASIADAFGIAENTLRRRLNPEDKTTYDPQLERAFKSGQAGLKEFVLGKLLDLVGKGNTAATIFASKAICGLLEVRKIEGTVEHTHTAVTVEEVLRVAKEVESSRDAIEGEVLEEESV